MNYPQNNTQDTNATPANPETKSQPDIDSAAQMGFTWLTMLAHIAGIAFPIAPTGIIYLLTRDRPGCHITEDNAREALNYQFLVVLITIIILIAGAIFAAANLYSAYSSLSSGSYSGGMSSNFFAMSFLFPLLLGALLFINFILCVRGAIKSSRGIVYRYPIALRLLRKR